MMPLGKLEVCELYHFITSNCVAWLIDMESFTCNQIVQGLPTSFTLITQRRWLGWKDGQSSRTRLPFSFTLSLSLSFAHSKCLTQSLRKASPLLFPWQLACIGIDDISWSPTYFALRNALPVNFSNAVSPSQKDDATSPTAEGRRRGEGGFFCLTNTFVLSIRECRHYFRRVTSSLKCVQEINLGNEGV